MSFMNLCHCPMDDWLDAAIELAMLILSDALDAKHEWVRIKYKSPHLHDVLMALYERRILNLRSLQNQYEVRRIHWRRKGRQA